MPLSCVHAWQVAATNAPGSLIGVKVSKWDDYDATACKIRSYMRRSGRFDFIQPARSGFKVVPFGQNPPSERPSPTAPPRGRNRRECRRTKRTRASVRPTAYAPGEVPAPPARQPPSLPRSTRASSPTARESPPVWRNVGPTLGSIRRLTEGLSKVPWAIAMRLSDLLPSMWGVRHHDSPPVSEWCS